ncbi:MAG: hypothetical protein ACXAEU_01565 [Candidatus Hodarchaeales archaeon]
MVPVGNWNARDSSKARMFTLLEPPWPGLNRFTGWHGKSNCYYCSSTTLTAGSAPWKRVTKSATGKRLNAFTGKDWSLKKVLMTFQLVTGLLTSHHWRMIGTRSLLTR